MAETSDDILAKETDTFERNKNDLLATAEGKYVLIKGDQVVGTYESEMDAIEEGHKQFGNVPILVKLVTQFEMPEDFVNNYLDV